MDLAWVIAEFQESTLPDLVPRSAMLPVIPRKADVLVGMRRTGKTFRLFQEIKRLLAEGVDKRDILYVNFEDDRLQPIGVRIVSELLEAFYRFNPEARRRGAYLFFDEIQNVPDWSRFVRRVLDTEEARVFLTGSSAKMLHLEVSTELRGRGFAVEVFPYSFQESLAASGIEVPDLPPGPRKRSEIEAQLLRYLEVGGFPEVQHMAPLARLQTLQDYVELVLLRDVVERHAVENATALRAFSRLLLQSPTRTFTVNKAHASLKSRGLQVGKDTLHAFLDHLEDAYLLFGMPIFKQSEQARATNPRKLYPVDPGLGWAMSHVTARDLGARLENAVFLELRRRYGRLRQGQLAYYRTSAGYEVDFVVGDVLERRPQRLVQVCTSLGADETRDREVRALAAAMDELGGDLPGEIVTLHEEDIIEVESGRIRVMPAWRWMLEGTAPT